MSAQPERPLHVVPERPQTSWTADELMALSFPEPTWAVPGLIAEGVTLLAGPPKVGKSWLSLNLGVSIASGDSALGSIDVESGPVLYLALEDTPRRLQSRMRTVLAGRRAPAGLTLDTYCPPLPAGGADYIAGWLDEHPGARLVVIDVFTKVRGLPPAGVSAYEADYAAIGHIKRVADAYGVPVVLVHHVRKAASDDFLTEVSGTNGLAGAADAVLVLKRGRAQADGVLHVTGRDVTENDYAMAFEADTGAWRLLDGPAEQHLMHDTRAAIALFVRDHPGRKPKEIADALAMKPDNIRSYLKRMAEGGQLRIATDGGYHPPGDPAGRDNAVPLDLSRVSRLSRDGADQGGQP
jgi:AAA domain